MADALRQALAAADLLEAMTRNYGDGPHIWDRLDRAACERGAAAIRAALSSALPVPEVQPVPAGYPCHRDCPGFKRNAMYGTALTEKQEEIVALEQRIANQRKEITRLEAALSAAREAKS